jgi:hypothetical protein
MLPVYKKGAVLNLLDSPVHFFYYSPT